MSNTTQPQRFQSPRNQREFKQYLGFDKKFGYLHELRKLNNDSNTYTVRISVPVGQSDSRNDNIRYINFELYVKPAEALMCFFEHRAAIADEDHKVTIRFSCSNIYPKAHIAQNGKYAGEAVPTLGGNLSYLHTMKVDGQIVHGFRANETASDEVVDTATGEVLPFTPDQKSSSTVATRSESTPESSEPPQRETPPLEAYEADMMDSSDSVTPHQDVVDPALESIPANPSQTGSAAETASDKPVVSDDSTDSKESTKRPSKRSSRSKTTRSQD